MCLRKCSGPQHFLNTACSNTGCTKCSGGLAWSKECLERHASEVHGLKLHEYYVAEHRVAEDSEPTFDLLSNVVVKMEQDVD